MNYLVKPFDNIKIRQAFALALNKDEIAAHVYKGTKIPTNHIVPQGMPGYFSDLTAPNGVKGTTGNPSLARQLFQQGLQEEGLTTTTLPPISITYAGGGGTDYRNELAAAQQMWQNALGISIKLNDVDRDKLISDIFATNNNPEGLQMWAYGWLADYPDPQDWLTLQFANGSQNNSMNYGQNRSTNATAQQQTQQAMEQADTDQDPVSRLQQYNKTEQQLINDVAWIPISQITGTAVRKPCVAGVVDNAQSQTPPDDWAAIYKTTATPCADITPYQ
jgi:peptide/nickel transport system substrate-binding protein/oligopeptide transport system substrate-binding protein